MDRKLIVSIDTEEDNWGWRSAAPYTAQNIRELPRLVRFFERLGVRPTFFVSYQVLVDVDARAVLRDLRSEECIEIGSHVHPWNTPPYDETTPSHTMLFHYPRASQHGKIRETTERLSEIIDAQPKSFRAGRFGFGASTASTLLELGYDIDSSVTPYWDWSASSDGQNFFGAPLDVYCISPAAGVLRDTPGGRLVEVPLTAGYTGTDVSSWYRTHRLLENRVSKAMHLGGVANVFGGPRRVILSPEAHTLEDTLALGRRVLDAGVAHLHLFFHSSSLKPGLTPFTATSTEVDRLYDRMEAMFDGLRDIQDMDFATVAEAGAAHGREITQPEVPHSEANPSAEWRPTPRSHIVTDGEYHGGTKLMLTYWAHFLYGLVGGYRRYQGIDWTRVKRLVFVCRGNICRSAYGEFWARAKGLPAASLGVETMPDGPANETAIRLGETRTIFMDHHRTTRVEDFDVRSGDLFLAMEPWQCKAIEELEWSTPHQVTLLGLWVDTNGPIISDPYGKADATFLDCFDLIERGVARIKRELGAA